MEAIAHGTVLPALLAGNPVCPQAQAGVLCGPQQRETLQPLKTFLCVPPENVPLTFNEQTSEDAAC